MQPKRRNGPLEEHWATTRRLVEVQEGGESFVCLICVSDGHSRAKSTSRSARSASNMYAHFKHVHSSIYAILEPIVRSRDKIKKQNFQSNTISDVMSSQRNKKFEEALINMFTCPDFSSRMLDNLLFKNVLLALNPNVRLPRQKRITSRTWDKCNATLTNIKQVLASSKFTALMFDG